MPLPVPESCSSSFSACRAPTSAPPTNFDRVTLEAFDRAKDDGLKTYLLRWMESEVVDRLRRLDAKLDSLSQRVDTVQGSVTETERLVADASRAAASQASGEKGAGDAAAGEPLLAPSAWRLDNQDQKEDVVQKADNALTRFESTDIINANVAINAVKAKAFSREEGAPLGEHGHHGHHEEFGAKYAMHPHSTFAGIWSFGVALAVLYICWLVPYTIGFTWYVKSTGMGYWGQILEIFFWIDMLQSFRTGFEHGGHLHLGLKPIAVHYLQFWFWVDLIANVPWEDVFTMLIEDKNQRKSFKIMKWFKLSKLIRLTRWRKMINTIGEGRGQYVSLGAAIFTIIFAIHFAGCLFISSLGLCEEYPPAGVTKAWKYDYEVKDELVRNDPNLGWRCEQSNLTPIYGESLHVGAALVLGQSLSSVSVVQAMSMLSDSLQGNEEAATYSSLFYLMSFMQLVGVLLVGNLFASMAKIIVLPNWRETAFWMRWDSVRRELEQHAGKIPHDLNHRVRRQVLARFRRSDYGKMQIMSPDILSHSLRLEVARAINSSVADLPCFKWAEPGLITSLNLAIRPVCYSREEIIYRVHDIVEGLLILEKGGVDLFTAEGDCFQSVDTMSIFGDTPVVAILIEEEKLHRWDLSRGANLPQNLDMQKIMATEAHDICSYVHIDSAIASVESVILVIPMEDLSGLCRRHPRLLQELVIRNTLTKDSAGGASKPIANGH
eukprot:TRINITY_DN5709_c0_g2_i1.p1 TRINITY_DN5709_c0_g2~~TRINITY_DN5709_c0_g2_i1.p1  ORF type:complete len:720 (+),score=132.58 TRINITY_DN5709_c0_g2_i1:64-2223(+)